MKGNCAKPLPPIERLKELLIYNPDSGALTWRVTRNGKTPAGSVAGFVNSHGYRKVSVDNEVFPAHRIAWALCHSELPPIDKELDHADGDKSNNAAINLRLATASENSQNRRSPRNATSGFMGVCWHEGTRKWVAQISHLNKNHHLGYFDLPEDAHTAYLEVKAKLHNFQSIPRESSL